MYDKTFPDKNTFITIRECTIVPEHSIKAYGRVDAQFY
jgi:hypothetical protein